MYERLVSAEAVFFSFALLRGLRIRLLIFIFFFFLSFRIRTVLMFFQYIQIGLIPSRFRTSREKKTS
jgi:hypothetical protein